jgi:hypothetical protein
VTDELHVFVDVEIRPPRVSLRTTTSSPHWVVFHAGTWAFSFHLPASTAAVPPGGPSVKAQIGRCGRRGGRVQMRPHRAPTPYRRHSAPHSYCPEVGLSVKPCRPVCGQLLPAGSQASAAVHRNGRYMHKIPRFDGREWAVVSPGGCCAYIEPAALALSCYASCLVGQLRAKRSRSAKSAASAASPSSVRRRPDSRDSRGSN